MSLFSSPDRKNAPLLKAHGLMLEPGAHSRMLTASGDFVYVESAAAGFELSLNGRDFIPVREGRLIQTRTLFETLYLRAAGTAVSIQLITGEGGITSFAAYGSINAALPLALMPYDSPAALANAPVESLATGVYTVLIAGSPPAAQIWQLRAWNGGADPVSDPDAGLIVPADYNAANRRVWFRA
jgi:hypothetical protein